MVTRIRPEPGSQRRIFLKEWRERSGITQEQLAERLGTTKASISRYESLSRDPSLAFLQAAAAALGRTVSDIVDVDPTKEGEVVDLLRHLPAEKREQAAAYLKFLATG